ncbi:uncharacterized protein TNCV_788441 [Trichonephila clavipes]|nr:uncharacterized protein TNCV_788441 [Trichonephila clavipes]
MGHERKRRQKKRKFHGNFRTAQKKVSEGSISSEKLGRGLSDTLFNVDSETLSGNRIFDIEILMSIFSILSCPVCYNQELYLIEDSRLGLQSNLCLKCKNCSFTKGFTSTSKVNNLNIINLLFVFGMRIIGKGFSAGKKLFSMLNIPYPSKCTYRQHEIKLLHAASQAANNSMLESAKSIAECSNECGVSVDGTWQKRGYFSLNGCVSTISVDSGKILDIEVISQYCRVCTKTEKTSGFSKKCVVSHFCKNHKGSASNMETVGVYRIFERSEANHSLRYTSYYGDGDSKVFNNVKDIYGYDSVVKYECIGHVQKRVGSRLRKLKITKGLGVGIDPTNSSTRLKIILGIAIRSNVGNLSNMQITAVIASPHFQYVHRQKPCMTMPFWIRIQWCKYRAPKQEGKLYKHRTAATK